MIAKHIPINSVSKSSFAGLVNYILDTQNKTERIGIVRSVNCFSDRADCVVAEVLNTQQMNSRATSDKTYHLVVSFRDDELSEEVLKKVEDQLCDGLGFGEHQRLSVVHHDTDHLHMHIAINKIHPSRLTIHNPHYDYKTIGELCENLEQEFGLTPDNHETKTRGAQSKESNIEFKAGSESLIGWMKQECLEQIQSAASWTELHQVLGDHGIELKVRGNGFVFVSSNGVGVKASSVDRSLSKANLIKKLGDYVKNNSDLDVDENIKTSTKTDTSSKDSKHYEKKPLHSKQDTKELYAQYKKEQDDAAINGKNEWIELRDKKNKAIDSAMVNARFRLLVIKNLDAGRFSKKIMYAAANERTKKRLDSINADYKQAYQSSKAKHKRMDWLSWLVKESAQGNKEALAVLRSRKNYKSQENNISGTKQDDDSHNNSDFIETITKTGTVIYNAGSTAIRDGGNKLVIFGNVAKDKIVEALKEAIKKFGNKLTINGTDSFREKVVQVVVAKNLDVTFDDEALEKRRQDIQNDKKSHGLSDQGLSGSGKEGAINKADLLKQKILKRSTKSTRKGRSR